MKKSGNRTESKGTAKADAAPTERPKRLRVGKVSSTERNGARTGHALCILSARSPERCTDQVKPNWIIKSASQIWEAVVMAVGMERRPGAADPEGQNYLFEYLSIEPMTAVLVLSTVANIRLISLNET